jgi:DNA-binding NarL/FixJ family response regulator
MASPDPKTITPPEPMTPPLSNLTPSQVRMLQGLADGLAPKQIAADMGIARGTLAYHLHQIYKQMDCHCAAHAVALALRKKLIN